MGRIGSETQSAEAQKKELNIDVDIRLKQLRSNEVDVDFAEAVAGFNVELARLEASQAAFAKLSEFVSFPNTSKYQINKISTQDSNQY